LSVISNFSQLHHFKTSLDFGDFLDKKASRQAAGPNSPIRQLAEAVSAALLRKIYLIHHYVFYYSRHSKPVNRAQPVDKIQPLIRLNYHFTI
jgi:hypothetical protein